MTIEQAYNDFIEKLKSIYESREAATISDWVFEKITGLNRLQRNSTKHLELKTEVSERLNDSLQRLLTHEPIQYVLGEAWFYKRKFLVNKHVLIPRPETEELVEWIITDVKNKLDDVRALDIGAGSGCIPVSLKKEMPTIEITAIDISEEALAVAKQNAALLEAQVQFKKVDFLNELSWKDMGVFDILISNPPYIPIAEKNILDKNVTEYEPHEALFVDNDPFVFYRKLAFFSNEHLKPGGKLYVEVHENYAKEVEQIFSDSSLKDVIIRKDIYGKERMVRATK
jgi:release factor glutamine methyltransferase